MGTEQAADAANDRFKHLDLAIHVEAATSYALTRRAIRSIAVFLNQRRDAATEVAQSLGPSPGLVGRRRREDRQSRQTVNERERVVAEDVVERKMPWIEAIPDKGDAGDGPKL